jgi:hypothetical protein
MRRDDKRFWTEFTLLFVPQTGFVPGIPEFEQPSLMTRHDSVGLIWAPAALVLLFVSFWTLFSLSLESIKCPGHGLGACNAV